MSYHEIGVKMAEIHIKQETLVAMLRKVQANLATCNRGLLAELDHLRDSVARDAAAEDADLDAAIGEAEALIGVPETMKQAAE